jgi:hypothetical protein
MRTVRLLVVLLLLPLPASAASEDADDWKLVGGVLAMVQQIVHLAAHSPDPQAAQKGVDAILGGGNAEANRIASGVMEEAMRDIPPSQRDAFASIGRDLLVLARRERAKADNLSPAAAAGDPVQARKDLQAMGLKYWDEQQFLDAVRRGDRIAVDLYLAAKGLEARNPLPAR